LLAAAFVPLPIFVAGLLLARYQPLYTKPWLLGIATGLGVWALVMFAVGRVVRGRSDSLRRFFTFAVLLLFPVPLLTVTLLFHYNGAYDTTPAVDHASKVERVWYSQAKNAHRTYYIAATGWEGDAPVKIRVPNAVAAQLTVGQPVTITTGAGKLGWEWLRGYRF
jgi:hypothetical protein